MSPLILEFNRVFGRNPNPPLENDIIFTHQDLNDWAKAVWYSGVGR